MYGTAPEEVVTKSGRMQTICQEAGIPLAAVAIQFQLAHPLFAAIIPGAKTPEEAKENRELLDFPVPKEVWNRFKQEGLLDENAPVPE